MNQKFKHLYPVVIVTAITIIVSLMFYNRVMDREEDRCWQLLKNAAQSVSNEILMKFQDNITTLGLAANAMIQENKTSPEQIDSLHLDAFEENTIFSRIDILYPDNTILYENGTLEPLRSDLSFDEIASRDAHISSRMTDSKTNHESVYYFLPVEDNGEVKAVLTGVIDLTVFPEIFKTSLYDGHAVACIVDSTDGNYIMDNWHEKLENAYDEPQRTNLKGYEDIDLKAEVQNQKEGMIAFESNTNGEDSYMYYMPIGIFNWELLIVSQKNIVFSSLLYLKKLLITVGIIELILLFVYFMWNLFTVDQLTKSQRETKEQLKISNTLIQCVTELSSDKDINVSIQNLLGIITSYFDSDRTYIFEIDAQQDILVNTYEYVRTGVTPQIDNLQDVPISLLPQWMETFYRFEPYYISSLEQEKGYPSYDILKPQDVNKLIAVPLGKKGHVIGFVGVDNPRQFYDDATLLSSIQFFLTNSLTTKKQQEQLQYMSFRDMLTGLYNRNKYIQKLDSLEGKRIEKTGVSYIDLNGLKQINDEKGHEAGDSFIRNAAKAISTVFPENAYRIGGDEFVIIAINSDEHDFHNRIEKLQETMAKRQISTSIGAIWVPVCTSLEQLLLDADHKMYEAKKQYYQTADRRSTRRH